jgi:antibiotic biosynthesis monooxygenase (ABM) superfamily enzyme
MNAAGLGGLVEQGMAGILLMGLRHWYEQNMPVGASPNWQQILAVIIANLPAILALIAELAPLFGGAVDNASVWSQVWTRIQELQSPPTAKVGN